MNTPVLAYLISVRISPAAAKPAAYQLMLVLDLLLRRNMCIGFDKGTP
ncbi:hypothetical protein [Desulfitobacterium hafniense]|nr:hypothetical protein [Desulfitobacterium hafniense]